MVGFEEASATDSAVSDDICIYKPEGASCDGVQEQEQEQEQEKDKENDQEHVRLNIPEDEESFDEELKAKEDKLYRRCFDKVDDLCGNDDNVDGSGFKLKFWKSDEDKANVDTEEEKRRKESLMDKRRDGKISINKLQRIISRLEDNENPLYIGPVVNMMDQETKKEIVKKTLNEIDTNNDGFICYDEFKTFVGRVRKTGRSQMYKTQESRYARVMDYFHAIGHGRVISKWPPPFFIISISIIQLGLFLGFQLQSHDHESAVCEDGEECRLIDAIFEKLQFDPKKQHEAWRYLSYCLVHHSWSHMVINLALQLLVGLLLEFVHKWYRVAPIYILGVVTASLGYYTVDRHALIGASGGIYCIVAACIPDIIMNWKEGRAFFISRWRDGKTAHAYDGKLLRFLRLFAVIAFATFDIGYVLANPHNETVSVWAHIFGAIAGVMVGLVWLKDSNEERWEKMAKRASGTGFAVIFLVMLGLNVGGCNNLPSTMHCSSSS